MQCDRGSILLSATDLVGHLSCGHLPHLDRAVALGQLQRPEAWEPGLELLRERGARHERGYGYVELAQIL